MALNGARTVIRRSETRSCKSENSNCHCGWDIGRARGRAEKSDQSRTTCLRRTDEDTKVVRGGLLGHEQTREQDLS